MTRLAAAVSLCLAGSALAGEQCYQLSADGKAWARTPEVLCVQENAPDAWVITLRTGLAPQTVATFNFNLAARVRCIDCNQDVFSLKNPENSVLNQLAVKFDGKREVKQEGGKPSVGPETGTVQVGANKFFYRSVATVPAAAPAPETKDAKNPRK